MCDWMPQNAKNKNQIFHIDANVLLNFYLDDDPDQHNTAQSLFNRSNTGDINIKINTFALGEVHQNIIKKYNYEYDKIAKLNNLFDNGKLEAFELKNITIDALTEEIKKLKDIDSYMSIGDILNIAIFLLDTEAKFFVTFDTGLNNKKIVSYLKESGKNIYLLDATER